MMGTSDGARAGWTPERREAQRQKMLAHWAAEENRKEQSEIIKKSWQTSKAKRRRIETGQRSKDALTGTRLSEEHKAKIADGLAQTDKKVGRPRGSKMSEEAKRQISKALLGKPKSAAHKAAMKAAWKRRKSGGGAR